MQTRHHRSTSVNVTAQRGLKKRKPSFNGISQRASDTKNFFDKVFKSQYLKSADNHPINWYLRANYDQKKGIRILKCIFKHRGEKIFKRSKQSSHVRTGSINFYHAST